MSEKKHTIFKYSSPNEPADSDYMRVVCVANLFGAEIELPAGEILIVAGGITATNTMPEISKFLDFIDSLDHKHKIICPSTHETDYVCDILHEFQEGPEYTFLEGDGINIGGLNINSVTAIDDKGEIKMELPEESRDIIVSAVSPDGCLSIGQRDHNHNRSKLLTEYIKKYEPMACICGGYTIGHGACMIGKTLVINPSVFVYGSSKPFGTPLVFDITRPQP